MAPLIWFEAFGGPMDGRMIAFPQGQDHLPVSFTNRKDDVSLYRVGDSIHDWNGTLAGHYYKAGDGRAHFLDVPRSVRGFYTSFSADGDDGN